MPRHFKDGKTPPNKHGGVGIQKQRIQYLMIILTMIIVSFITCNLLYVRRFQRVALLQITKGYSSHSIIITKACPIYIYVCVCDYRFM